MNTPTVTSEHICSDITGVVLTKNGERLIEQCLSSLSFCSHLLVVDSGSTDNTLAIAQKFNAEIMYREWDGFATQFTFAQTLVKTRWFFIVDQDEICPEELGNAVMQAIAEADTAYRDARSQNTSVDTIPVAFSVGRKSWYFDRFMLYSGWYPDHILRVFKKDFVEFYQDAHIHYRALGASTHIGQKGAELIHYPYTSFFHQLEKLNTYAEQGAQALLASGKQGGIWKGIGHGAMRFIRLYILKRGFLDGKAGFLCACHGSIYAFLKYARAVNASWGKPYDKE